MGWMKNVHKSSEPWKNPNQKFRGLENDDLRRSTKVLLASSKRRDQRERQLGGLTLLPLLLMHGC